MADLLYGDIIQQYHKNLVLYKGIPVRVEAVDRESKVTLLHILTQDLETVPFNLIDFKPHSTRLGMMNIHKTVVYVTRMPVRKMQIGLNAGNISIQFLDVAYKLNKEVLLDSIRNVGDKGFDALIKGDYPSFGKAIAIAKDNKDICAFDRQFAVRHDGMVYYKTKIVGEFVNTESESDIVFHERYKHLVTLLGNNHEKTVGIACST